MTSVGTISAAVSSSAVVFEWSYLVLLVALEQFENQAANRLIFSMLEECEDLGTTQKEDVKKTCTSQMLPSTLT